jgi:hypothetical protein
MSLLKNAQAKKRSNQKDNQEPAKKKKKKEGIHQSINQPA